MVKLLLMNNIVDCRYYAMVAGNREYVANTHPGWAGTAALAEVARWGRAVFVWC